MEYWNRGVEGDKTDPSLAIMFPFFSMVQRAGTIRLLQHRVLGYATELRIIDLEVHGHPLKINYEQ